jgi:hypothetical protein
MSKNINDVNKVGDGGNANVPTNTDPDDQQQQAAAAVANPNQTSAGGAAGGVDDLQADQAEGDNLDDSKHWDGGFYSDQDFNDAFAQQQQPGAREGFVAIQKGGYGTYNIADHIRMLNMALPQPVPLSNNPTMVEIIKAGNRTLERIAEMKKHAKSEAGSEDTFYGSTPKPASGHMTRRQAALLEYRPPSAAELDARLKQRRFKRYLFQQADSLQERLDPLLRDPTVYTAQTWSNGANADAAEDVDQEEVAPPLDETGQTVVENVVVDNMDVDQQAAGQHADDDDDLDSVLTPPHERQEGSMHSFIADMADPYSTDKEKSDQFRSTMALRHSAKATTKAIVVFLDKFLQHVAGRQLSMTEYNTLRDRHAKLLAAQEQWSDMMASAASLAPFHQHYRRFPERLEAWIQQENMDFVTIDVQVDMQLQEMQRLIQYHEKYTMGGAMLNVTPSVLETPSPFKSGVKNPQRLTTIFDAAARDPLQDDERGEESKNSVRDHQRPPQQDELRDGAETAPTGAAAAAGSTSSHTPMLPPHLTGAELRRRALRFHEPPVRPVWADQQVTPPPTTGGADAALLRSAQGQLQGQQLDITAAPVMLDQRPPRSVFDRLGPRPPPQQHQQPPQHRQQPVLQPSPAVFPPLTLRQQREQRQQQQAPPFNPAAATARQVFDAAFEAVCAEGDAYWKEEYARLADKFDDQQKMLLSISRQRQAKATATPTQTDVVVQLVAGLTKSITQAVAAAGGGGGGGGGDPKQSFFEHCCWWRWQQAAAIGQRGAQAAADRHREVRRGPPAVPRVLAIVLLPRALAQGVGQLCQDAFAETVHRAREQGS